jgi:drug/metabolite transporter (DMT)-like permease
LKDKNLTPYFSALSHTLIVGLSFLFSKTTLKYATPVDVLAFRFTVSFIAFLSLILFKKISISYEKKSLFKICLVGLLSTAFYSFQTLGLVHATSSECGILQPTTPIFTMILSGLFLKERTTIYQKISILLSVIGVIYIFIMQGASFDYTKVLGIFLLILSSLSGAGYSVLARRTLRDASITVISFASIFTGFLIFTTASVISHFLKGTLNQFPAPLQSFEFIASIIYLGILASLTTSLLSNYTLSKIEAAKMSVFGNVRTIIAIFAGVFFLKEQLFSYHIIGSIMIIAGVIGTNYAGHKSEESLDAKTG